MHSDREKLVGRLHHAITTASNDDMSRRGWGNEFVYLPGTVTPKKLWEMTVQQREAAHD